MNLSVTGFAVHRARTPCTLLLFIALVQKAET